MMSGEEENPPGMSVLGIRALPPHHVLTWISHH